MRRPNALRSGVAAGGAGTVLASTSGRGELKYIYLSINVGELMSIYLSIYLYLFILYMQICGGRRGHRLCRDGRKG